MREKILAVVVVAVIMSAAVVCAEETVFNKASKCIAGWKAPCCLTATYEKCATAKKAEAKPMRQACTTDVLGNKVPTGTVKDGGIK